MITATITDLLEGDLGELDARPHFLYVVKDGETVFYVGMSQHVTDRLLGHFGMNAFYLGGESNLAKLVEANAPDSLVWQIELKTVPECLPEAKDREGAFINDQEWQVTIPYLTSNDLFDKNIVERVEKYLIGELRPVVNIQWNNNPTRLPEKYNQILVKDTFSGKAASRLGL